MYKILHISDLHFYNDVQTYNMQEILINEARQAFVKVPKGYKLLIVTGDFHNFFSDYVFAERFLSHLIEAMDIDPAEDVFVIPGNHDVGNDEALRALGIDPDDIRECTQRLKDREMKYVEDRLKAYIPYCNFVHHMGFYPNSGDPLQPARVHVRQWREKLNIMHMNTTLVADGSPDKSNQITDITSTSDPNTWEGFDIEGFPAIALGHNHFFDLAEDQQKQIKAVFALHNISAYLCGDTHRLERDPSNQMIPLSSRAIQGRLEIPNFPCAKSISDMEDDYSDFGYYLHEWDEKTGNVNVIFRRWKPDYISCTFHNHSDDGFYRMRPFSNDIDNKEKGLEHIAASTPIKYKKRISQLHGQNIPDNTGLTLITRFILPYDNAISENTNDSIPSPFDCLKQEKFIVLLAGAGEGKTYTLQQIYHEAEDKGFHAFFYQLQSLVDENVFYLIAEDAIEIDEPIVFIFDGFDEMSEDGKTRFVSMVKKVRALYPQMLIIISSRENIYSRQFNNAHLYMIKKVTSNEIVALLSNVGIDISQWSEEAKKKDLNNVTYNMFYLSALIEIWKQEGALPSKSQLMKALIDMRIRKDIDHVYTQSLIQKQKQPDTRNAFKQIALIMQCMHRYYLSAEEVADILTPEMQEIMTYHGLWTSSKDGHWFFIHNNYREYLAAEALSSMDLEHVLGFIANNPDRKSIKPTWINTLSYLTSIYRSNELQNWIYNNQPKLISLFERDRFTKEQLTNILKGLISQSKKDGSWIETHNSLIRDLVVFCSTPDSVQYIINELQLNQTKRHKQNLLRILTYFPTYFENEDTVKTIVSGIAFEETENLHIRCDAFRIMVHHPHLFEEYTDNAAELCIKQKNEYLLYVIISFIHETGKAEIYIDTVIDAYDKYDYHNNHLISLKTMTYSILESIQGIEAACKVLSLYDKWSRKPSKRKEDILKLFKVCCDIGAKFYDGENNAFLTVLLSLLQKKNRLLDHDFFIVLQKYIEQTHTELLFLDCIITHQPLTHCGYILSQLISDSMVETIKAKVIDKSIDIRIIKDIILRLPYKCKHQNMLINTVYFYTCEMITIDPPRDYVNEQQIEHQKFFDALFDEKLFDALVDELIQLLGKEAKICEASFHTLFSETKMSHVNEALYDCYFSLRDLSSADEEMNIIEYRNHIKDWDEFCFYNAEHCIENHHVNVNDNQLKVLTNLCLQYLTSVDLEECISINDKQLSFPYYLYSATKMFKLLSVQCSEELATKLLILPPELFESDDYNHLPKCITSQICSDILKQCVIEHIHTKKWNRFTAPGLIQYCIENRITECRAEITEYILDKDFNGGYTYPGLDYLEELYGNNVILSDVLPVCANDELLADLSSRIPCDMPSALLDQKLWDAYRKSSESRWLVALIKHNNVEALQEYYKQAKELMSLPDMVKEPYISEITDAIHDITSSSCISVLVNLFVLAYDPGFKDINNFGLRHSCWNALKAIARKDYEKTQDALLAATTNEDSLVNTSLQDLCHEINNERKYVQDIPLDFESAKLLVVYA